MSFPKPASGLKPNTAEFERLPLVKPTGFREYDARWLYPQEINLMGMQAIGLGLATLMRGNGRARAHRDGARLPLLFLGHQAVADERPAGGRRGGVRHWAGPVADGLFRPVRAASGGRRHGDGQPQRQRLDRHQDGHGAAAHLRAGGDRRAARHRAGGAFRAESRRAVSLCGRSGRALYRRPDEPAETQAPHQDRVRVRQRHGGGVRAAGAGGRGLRGCAAEYRPGLEFPQP